MLRINDERNYAVGLKIMDAASGERKLVTVPVSAWTKSSGQA